MGWSLGCLELKSAAIFSDGLPNMTAGPDIDQTHTQQIQIALLLWSSSSSFDHQPIVLLQPFASVTVAALGDRARHLSQVQAIEE